MGVLATILLCMLLTEAIDDVKLPPPPASECVDFPDWKAEKSKLTCDNIGGFSMFCYDSYFNDTGINGMTAAEACCDCGGGAKKDKDKYVGESEMCALNATNSTSSHEFRCPCEAMDSHPWFWHQGTKFGDGCTPHGSDERGCCLYDGCHDGGEWNCWFYYKSWIIVMVVFFLWLWVSPWAYMPFLQKWIDSTEEITKSGNEVEKLEAYQAVMDTEDDQHMAVWQAIIATDLMWVLTIRQRSPGMALFGTLITLLGQLLLAESVIYLLDQHQAECEKAKRELAMKQQNEAGNQQIESDSDIESKAPELIPGGTAGLRATSTEDVQKRTTKNHEEIFTVDKYNFFTNKLPMALLAGVQIIREYRDGTPLEDTMWSYVTLVLNLAYSLYELKGDWQDWKEEMGEEDRRRAETIGFFKTLCWLEKTGEQGESKSGFHHFFTTWPKLVLKGILALGVLPYYCWFNWIDLCLRLREMLVEALPEQSRACARKFCCGCVCPWKRCRDLKETRCCRCCKMEERKKWRGEALPLSDFFKRVVTKVEVMGEDLATNVDEAIEVTRKKARTLTGSQPPTPEPTTPSDEAGGQAPAQAKATYHGQEEPKKVD